MFKNDEDMDRADWPLLQNGAVTLFWRPDLLGETQVALRTLGYKISEVTGRSGWSDFTQQMSSVLHWEKQFGYARWTGNLNAFNDGVKGYPFDSSNRSVLIIRDFNALVDENVEGSRTLLDILEGSARDHLLWGRILIVLIQTSDNRYDSGPIGGRSAHWNQREWMNANRGL